MCPLLAHLLNTHHVFKHMEVPLGESFLMFPAFSRGSHRVCESFCVSPVFSPVEMCKKSVVCVFP